MESARAEDAGILFSEKGLEIWKQHLALEGRGSKRAVQVARVFHKGLQSGISSSKKLMIGVKIPFIGPKIVKYILDDVAKKNKSSLGVIAHDIEISYARKLAFQTSQYGKVLGPNIVI